MPASTSVESINAKITDSGKEVLRNCISQGNALDIIEAILSRSVIDINNDDGLIDRSVSSDGVINKIEVIKTPSVNNGVKGSILTINITAGPEISGYAINTIKLRCKPAGKDPITFAFIKVNGAVIKPKNTTFRYIINFTMRDVALDISQFSSKVYVEEGVFNQNINNINNNLKNNKKIIDDINTKLTGLNGVTKAGVDDILKKTTEIGNQFNTLSSTISTLTNTVNTNKNDMVTNYLKKADADIKYAKKSDLSTFITAAGVDSKLQDLKISVNKITDLRARVKSLEDDSQKQVVDIIRNATDQENLSLKVDEINNKVNKINEDYVKTADLKNISGPSTTIDTSMFLNKDDAAEKYVSQEDFEAYKEQVKNENTNKPSNPVNNNQLNIELLNIKNDISNLQSREYITAEYVTGAVKNETSEITSDINDLEENSSMLNYYNKIILRSSFSKNTLDVINVNKEYPEDATPEEKERIDKEFKDKLNENLLKLDSIVPLETLIEQNKTDIKNIKTTLVNKTDKLYVDGAVNNIQTMLTSKINRDILAAKNSLTTEIQNATANVSAKPYYKGGIIIDGGKMRDGVRTDNYPGICDVTITNVGSSQYYIRITPTYKFAPARFIYRKPTDTEVMDYPHWSQYGYFHVEFIDNPNALKALEAGSVATAIVDKNIFTTKAAFGANTAPVFDLIPDKAGSYCIKLSGLTGESFFEIQVMA